MASFLYDREDAVKRSITCFLPFPVNHAPYGGACARPGTPSVLPDAFICWLRRYAFLMYD